MGYLNNQIRYPLTALPCLKKHATPHDFRRTMIGGLLGAGVDIVTVQHLAGHEDVSTTARYDRRGEDDKRKAAAKVELPMPDLDGISTAKPKRPAATIGYANRVDKPKAKRKSKWPPQTTIGRSKPRTTW